LAGGLLAAERIYHVPVVEAVLALCRGRAVSSAGAVKQIVAQGAEINPLQHPQISAEL